MGNRMRAAGCCAVFGAAILLAPVEGAARSGMRGGGAFHGGARFHATPPLVQRPASFFGARITTHSGYHRGVGVGLGYAGGYSGGWYGTSYSPSNYVMIHDRPLVVNVPAASPPRAAAPAPPPVIQVIKYRPGCASETTTLPGSDGKEQAITIVRC